MFRILTDFFSYINIKLLILNRRIQIVYGNINTKGPYFQLTTIQIQTIQLVVACIRSNREDVRTTSIKALSCFLLGAQFYPVLFFFLPFHNRATLQYLLAAIICILWLYCRQPLPRIKTTLAFRIRITISWRVFAYSCRCAIFPRNY